MVIKIEAVFVKLIIFGFNAPTFKVAVTQALGKIKAVFPAAVRLVNSRRHPPLEACNESFFNKNIDRRANVAD